MEDVQNIVEYAARSLNSEFLWECEKHVKENYCNGEDCEEFPHCDVAQHDVKILLKHVWYLYVRMN